MTVSSFVDKWNRRERKRERKLERWKLYNKKHKIWKVIIKKMIENKSQAWKAWRTWRVHNTLEPKAAWKRWFFRPKLRASPIHNFNIIHFSHLNCLSFLKLQYFNALFISCKRKIKFYNSNALLGALQMPYALNICECPNRKALHIPSISGLSSSDRA